MERLAGVASAYSLLTAFVFVGVVILVSYGAARRLSGGRLHGSAIAIALGLVLAWAAGVATGGSNGVADYPLLAGVGVLGGAMFRDFAIVATGFGVRLADLRAAGWVGALSVPLGVVLSFVAGAATYIVGPVTGASLGVSSEIVSLSIAAGLVKAVLVMILTPLVARRIGLDNPASAMIFGGLIGTTSGVTAGLAATDPKLVPYGAMTSAFYTGLGCLLAPSVLYLGVRALLG